MRKTLWVTVVVLVLSWAVLGPHPADNSHYRDSDYQKQTLAALVKAPLQQAQGPLSIGIAETDITPKIGQPLAGYGARKPMAAEGVETPCYARALTLSVNGKAVTLLTGDYLLATDDLVDAVLNKTGLSRRELFFTASHTHSGPGGYGERTLEKMVFGDYDQVHFDRLVGQLFDVISRSRQQLQPAEFAMISKEVADSQINRVDSRSRTFDHIQTLVFRSADAGNAEPPIALLTVFGAHATILGRKNKLAAAGYPGYLVDKLKRDSGAAMVMFASGSVGDSSARRPLAKNDIERARIYGERLADAVSTSVPQVGFQREVVLGSLSTPVQLPPRRISVGAGWTMGSVLKSLIGDRRSHHTLLRIGPVVMAGFPGDYSGHLATALQKTVAEQIDPSVVTVATSFSGGYEGYLVSQYWHKHRDGYETRLMNFFGPWLGDYMNDLSVRMAKRLFADIPAIGDKNG